MTDYNQCPIIFYQGNYWRLKPKRKCFLNRGLSRLRRKLGHKFHKRIRRQWKQLPNL